MRAGHSRFNERLAAFAGILLVTVAGNAHAGCKLVARANNGVWKFDANLTTNDRIMVEGSDGKSFPQLDGSVTLQYLDAEDKLELNLGKGSQIYIKDDPKRQLTCIEGFGDAAALITSGAEGGTLQFSEVTVNGEKLAAGTDKGQITLRIRRKSEGDITLEVSSTNLKKIQGQAFSPLRIEFKKGVTIKL